MTRRPKPTVASTATPATSTGPAGPTDPTDPKILGDILFADAGAPSVPEQEWVDLVRAIAGRDQAALRALYERSHRLTYTLIMRITHDSAAAEELTIDVFHDVWRRAGSYDPKNGTVLGWIMNQARSRALDRLRYQQRQKRVNPYPDESPGVAESDALEDSIGRDELTERLAAAAHVLTAAEREAVEAAYFRDMTHAEIAEQSQVPLGTVKTRIRSAIAKLRREMSPDKEVP